MNVTTIEPKTIKEIRKAMRNLENWHETLLIKGICQIVKTGKTGYAYGPVPELDDSDPMTDYSAWTYCLKEKYILENIASVASIN